MELASVWTSFVIASWWLRSWISKLRSPDEISAISQTEFLPWNETTQLSEFTLGFGFQSFYQPTFKKAYYLCKRTLLPHAKETTYLFFLPVGEKVVALFVEVQSVLNQDYHQVGKEAEKKYTAYQSLPLFSDLIVPELLQ